MWYHEMSASGKLASSHIALVFCALVQNNMIVDDLLAMEFEDIPNDFKNHKLSPMDYCLAYTDGEIYDQYIKAKYRKTITDLFDSGQIFQILFAIEGLEHDYKHETYTLKCNWQNVDVIANWLKRQFA
jgi:hypothetical protein